MTNKYQVVARFRSDDPAPRFTKSCDIDELMARIMKELPVDCLYMVIPHEDGQGYSMRELGFLTLNVVTRDQLGAVEPQLDQEAQEWMGADLSKPTIDPGPQVFNRPTPDPSPHPFTPAQPAAMTGEMKFDKPKSQKELLKARGIKDPANRQYGVKAQQVDQEPQAKKPRKRKASKPKGEEDDSNLPNPVSRSRRVVNGISTATPAEAAAASHFNPSGLI